MNKNYQQIWEALCKLDDYFSGLGGAAGYSGMSGSEIFLYVASRLLQRHMPSYEPGEFIDKNFLEAASPVLEKVDAHIDAVNMESEALSDFITEFIQYADSKLTPKDRSPRWNRFIDLIDQ